MIKMSCRCCMAVFGTAGAFAILLYMLSYFTMPWKKYDIEYKSGLRATDSLQLLFVVSHNGNHGYEYDYPGDPYPTNDSYFWPYATKELTPRGRDQMYNLGVKVRTLYSGFIPITFYPRHLRATSIPLDLVLMSGETFLAGLYQPRNFQVWYNGLDWQPTALYSDSPDRSLDINSGVCPKFNEESKICVESTLKKHEANFTELSNYLTNVTGADFTTSSPEKLLHLQQKAFSEKYEDYILPEWLEAVYDKLRALVSDLYLAMFAGTQAARLLAGELTDQMMATMIQKVNGSLIPGRKTFYYSSQAPAIISLQRILGVPMDSMVGMVKPGSGLIVELHRSNITQEYYIQLVYLDGSSLEEEPLMLNMTGCGYNCSFIDLLEKVCPFTRVNFTLECQLNGTMPSCL